MTQVLLPYRRPPEISGRRRRVPVVVVGAGPVGLSTGLDLGMHGVQTIILDQDASTSEGSRAICFAKRTLEILDRLGCGDQTVAKGVVWNLGKIFLGSDLLYEFNLLPDSGHKRPAFINLQQYYLEQFLIERLAGIECVQLRGRNCVVGLTSHADCVQLAVETPDGRYDMECDYLVACDGARSSIRNLLGLESRGQVFRDRFLIADVKMLADFPTERWFWFDPPFHPNQSVLLHRQADNVWRIDFQLGWGADPEAEKQSDRVTERIRAMLGPDRPFTLEWVSIYTFQCKRMEQFRHGRVFFAGDAAHQVSPFGARGANGGIQDADNLAWKLRLVLQGKAPDSLLDSYHLERAPAADENILNSTRSTDFITPKSAVSRAFRDATLQLARRHAFARKLVNSGRLSTPATYAASPLNTPDEDVFDGMATPGAPAPDAPLDSASGPTWLLDRIGGAFTLLYYTGSAPLPEQAQSAFNDLAKLPVRVEPVSIAVRGARAGLEDAKGFFAQRFDARIGTAYLIRPDQHVAARWRRLDPEKVAAALARALTATTTAKATA